MHESPGVMEPPFRIWECGMRHSKIVFELCICILNPKSEMSNLWYQVSGVRCQVSGN